jgi:preprotein translocase subunit SecD
MMSVLKDIRFISLVVLLFAAVAMIGAPTFIKANYVQVDDVLPESKCSLKEGDVINQIYSTIVTDAESFDRALANVQAGDRVTMVVNSGPFNCEAAADRSLGLTIRENKLETLKLGIDIEGGTRVLLSPTESVTIEQLAETVKTLENRINFYGLKEVKVNTLGNNLIQIEMSGATGDEIRDFLAKQGKFSGKLWEQIKLTGGKGTLKVSNSTHEISAQGSQVVVDGKSYSINETFTASGENFQIISASNNTVILHAHLFDEEDIVNVLSDSRSSGVRALGDGFYEFTFGVQVSRDGADRFAKLTAGQPVTRTVGTDKYIEPKLLLFLDETLITELNIQSSLAGQKVTSAVITGSAQGLEEANAEKLRLESTLRSGSLPIKLEIAKVDTITQTAGRELINSTIFVALAAVIAVSAIIFYRYRDYKIVLPMVIISMSEIVIVVGMATSQILAGVVIAIAAIIGIIKREVIGVIGWITLLVMVMVASTIVISPWTLDIPAIAGLIAILGTGVNQMIIMTDQLFKEKGKTLPERHKSAMHIIWSSAAIVAFAMIPLILGGIGSLKGFAIATIVGVLVGILVTRPAYVAILERIKRTHLESL